MVSIDGGNSSSRARPCCPALAEKPWSRSTAAQSACPVTSQSRDAAS
ncbi:hypothetical protein ACIBF6_02560 [Streptosporangium amethystogenes]